MSFDETDVINRLRAVGDRFEMPAGTLADDVHRGRRRVRRNRTITVVAAAAAVALIAVGGGLAAGTSGGSDQPSPAVDPTTSSLTTEPESAEPTPLTLPEELDAIVAQHLPGWTTANGFPEEYDYAFNGPCSGNWGKGAGSGGDGGISAFGIGHLGFPSEARAADAAARFAQSLKSCSTTEWRVQPIAQTGALLASSPQGVAWIQQGYREVWVMQAPTTDGPPPASAQVAIVEWLTDYIAEQNTD